MSRDNYIQQRVHELYWDKEINCAGTALICLSEIYQVPLEPQVIWSAVGLHGKGASRIQCGLAEGPLLFLGICLHGQKKGKEEIIQACHDFSVAFNEKFGSLLCSDLRPESSPKLHPPLSCETFTCQAIQWTCRFLADSLGLLPADPATQQAVQC